MVVNVCIGSACHLQGSYDIITHLQKLIADNGLTDKVEIKASFCLGNCLGAVAVKCQDQIYSVQPDNVEKFFHDVLKERV